MDNRLPNRKHPRFDHYDYSRSGAYFVTICTQYKRCMLSYIMGKGLSSVEINASVAYTKYGVIAEKQLLLLEERYPFLMVDQFVIMPNHIHIILRFASKDDPTQKRTSLTDIVCAYKSLTTRECKKIGDCGKLFQTSFYEHVIRDGEDYYQIKKYIIDNPKSWYYDELFMEK